MTTPTQPAPPEAPLKELTAARADADRLRGTLEETNAALVSIRADRPSAHTDELWGVMNRAINRSNEALEAAKRALAEGEA